MVKNSRYIFSADQGGKSINIGLPETVRVKTPSLSLGGQAWQNLDLSFNLLAKEQQIKVSSENLKGELQIFAQQPWVLNIDYLYYNPMAFPGNKQPVAMTLPHSILAIGLK